MATYAKRTEVPIERSKAELERVLARFGARRRMIFQDDDGPFIVIAFDAGTRRFKLQFPLPARDAYAGIRAFQQAERSRWREIVAYLKATLIAVEAGFITLEQAFLAHTMLPDGETVGQWMDTQIEDIARNGQMPPMLPWAAPGGIGGQVMELPPARDG